MKDSTTPNRFRSVFPDACPWRERRNDDPMAAALADRDATDAEAADVFAADAARVLKDLRRYVERRAEPIVFHLTDSESVRAAVIAEREACAREAESVASGVTAGGTTVTTTVGASYGARIAAAIRARK